MKRFFQLLLLLVPITELQAQTVTPPQKIDSVRIVSRTNTSDLRMDKDSRLSIDMELMSSMPKLLGNTDPLNILKNLPGVQTVSDYDSGINIQGCDDSHTIVSIDGVPIYGAKHLLGLFSVFNPSHFDSFDFERNPTSDLRNNRIGGSVDMKHKKIGSRTVSGEISSGLISSQGTLSFKIGKKSQFNLSARQSYMNLLYKRWLRFNELPLGYGFGDYNLSFVTRPDGRNLIYLEGYYGADKMTAGQNGGNIFDMSLRWSNYAAALHWDHEFRNSSTLEQKIWTSSYRSETGMKTEANDLTVPAYIRGYGYEGRWSWKGINAGASCTLYDIMPQYPHFNEADAVLPEKELQFGAETDLHAGYSHEFSSGLGFAAGLKATVYISPEKKTWFHLSPSASISYDSYSWGRLRLAYALQRQYLFKGSLSNIGMPVDFWFMAGKHSDPQYAHAVDLTYSASFLEGMLTLDVGAYYKQLYHQIEYEGNLLDYFTMKYDLDRFLLKGDGQNFGTDVMLSKTSGSFTGWVSWSFGRALRRFTNEGYEGIYPSNHERIHELNAAASYKFRKWTFSASAIFATGLPFTPPSYFYITSQQIVAIYGEHNSARMRPYFRMDLSVDYSFIRKGHNDFGINASVYNVTGSKNDAMYLLNVADGRYSLEAQHFMLRFLPSVSLYYRF